MGGSLSIVKRNEWTFQDFAFHNHPISQNFFGHFCTFSISDFQLQILTFQVQALLKPYLKCKFDIKSCNFCLISNFFMSLACAGRRKNKKKKMKFCKKILGNWMVVRGRILKGLLVFFDNTQRTSGNLGLLRQLDEFF